MQIVAVVRCLSLETKRGARGRLGRTIIPHPSFTAFVIVIVHADPPEIFVVGGFIAYFLDAFRRVLRGRTIFSGLLPNCGKVNIRAATMGSLKRKEGPSGSSTSKTARPATEARPSKRAKPSNSTKDDGKKGAKQPKSPASKQASSLVVTKLKEEEPLFPRGGGSVLTPLEQKQIQIQAKKDVLFEEASGKKGDKGDKGDKGSKRKKRKSRVDEAAEKPIRDEDAVKVESLNFKVGLGPGCRGYRGLAC